MIDIDLICGGVVILAVIVAAAEVWSWLHTSADRDNFFDPYR
jgi:hypothetical protein